MPTSTATFDILTASPKTRIGINPRAMMARVAEGVSDAYASVLHKVAESNFWRNPTLGNLELLAAEASSVLTPAEWAEMMLDTGLITVEGAEEARAFCSELTEGEEYTLVSVNGMGFITYHQVRLVAATAGKYAQYDNAVQLITKGKGKRTESTEWFYSQGDRTALVVMPGWCAAECKQVIPSKTTKFSGGEATELNNIAMRNFPGLAKELSKTAVAVF